MAVRIRSMRGALTLVVDDKIINLSNLMAWHHKHPYEDAPKEWNGEVIWAREEVIR